MLDDIDRLVKENNELRDLLEEARPHVETAAEEAEERGIENGSARRCFNRINVLLDR